MREPSIVSLDYLNASGRMWGPYYTEIVYRFALFDGAGVRLTDWRVRGFGVYDMNLKPSDPGGAEAVSVLRSGETAWMSEAPRRAIEAATVSFVTGFERVPELIRLTRNLPLVGVNVLPDAQVTRPLATGVEVEYPGVVSLRVEPAAVPAPPKDLVKEEPRTPPVLPVRLTLHNAGSRRLALDPPSAARTMIPSSRAQAKRKPAKTILKTFPESATYNLVGFFKSEENAKALAEQLARHGIQSHQDKIPYGDWADPRFRVFVVGKDIFRVREVLGDVPLKK